MLLSDGQCGGVNSLVDLLSLSGLKGVEAFPAVTHPTHISKNMFYKTSLTETSDTGQYYGEF